MRGNAGEDGGAAKAAALGVVADDGDRGARGDVRSTVPLDGRLPGPPLLRVGGGGGQAGGLELWDEGGAGTHAKACVL